MDQIEELKKEIVSLRIRLKRVEDLLLSQSNPKDYIHSSNDLDVLFENAIELFKDYDEVSASLLQRRLTIGYSRAARILDQLEEKGYVGKAEGAKPRKVLKK
jgi:S-DNA-T family DNA segregation ATPase FtsK/SpoIIIE